MNNISTRLLSLTCIVAILVLTSCKGDTVRNNDALFTLMPATGINFENNVADKEFDNSFLFRNFYNGGGVAIGDLNNDSLPDVFLHQTWPIISYTLTRAISSLTILPRKAALSRIACGAQSAFRRYKQRWLARYIRLQFRAHEHRSPQKSTFINNHNLTFTESAKQYGLDISAYSTQSIFF